LREPDLNWRPSGYEPDELPGCSIPRPNGLNFTTASKYLNKPIIILILLSENWLREPDLNWRPSGYEPDELPGCSIPRPNGLNLTTASKYLNKPIIILILLSKNWFLEPLSNEEGTDLLFLYLNININKLVAGARFELTTFGLWARRATRLLHPASE
jgi:hypothetical protein